MNSGDHDTRFVLHPRLERDTIWLGSLDLSEVRLMNDSRYPWVILVPRIPDVCDITDLSTEQRQRFNEEITEVASMMKHHFRPERLNIAMLGNLVPQLHCHVIARFRQDFAWAGPVWGVGRSVAYTSEQLEKTVTSFQKLLSL